MWLTRTRELVRAMTLEEWPPIWPTGPEAVRDADRCFRTAIGVSSGARAISPLRLHIALDEWLLTQDRELLSVGQRAVCGCALLELFAAGSQISRESPDILDALINIAPAMATAQSALTRVVHPLLREMARDSKELGMSADEHALVAASTYIVGLLVRTSRTYERAGMAAWAKVIKAEANRYDMQRLRRIIGMASEWKRMPLLAKQHLLSECNGTRARSR